MALVGRHMLPVRDPAEEFVSDPQSSLEQAYTLGTSVSVVRLPDDSALAGKTLAESRFGSILGLNVVGIIRNGKTELMPEPTSLLRDGDRLIGDWAAGSTGRVEGRATIGCRK